jgi:hypothetical protein
LNVGVVGIHDKTYLEEEEEEEEIKSETKSTTDHKQTSQEPPWMG